MKKAYLHFIKYALDRDCSISVFDSVEWTVENSKSYKKIKDEIEGVDEVVVLRVFDDKEDYVCTVSVLVEWNSRPDETIHDYTVCDFMDEWHDNYFQIS